MRQLPSVVALGGGHGLAASLTALRRVTDRLTAIVTVADDGGSSGRLRAAYPDMLPPGDLRMALAALCGDDPSGRQWADVLQSRFPGDSDLAGHAIGNLLLAGVWQRVGDSVDGLDMVAGLLNARGRVLPMATVPLEIEADVVGALSSLPDEVTVVRGQEKVALTDGQIQHVRLVPSGPAACPQALDAIRDADYVVLGPGSWFSSVIPHLLVPQQAEALAATSATKILTLNLEPFEETDGWSAARHIESLAEHAPTLRLDYVIAATGFGGHDRHIKRWVQSLGGELILADVAMRDGSPRHDPLRLASVYADLMGV